MLYVFGGKTNYDVVCQHIERYDEKVNKWVEVAWKFPILIHSATCIALNSTDLLICGGKHVDDYIPCAYIFDFSNNTYKSKPCYS